MKPLYTALLTLVTLVGCASTNVKSSDPVVSWQAPEGQARLDRSQKTDFFLLANQFSPQSNKAYCGPSSVAIVLNAARLGREEVKKPLDADSLPKGLRKYAPKGFELRFERYTQGNVLGQKSPKTPAQVLGKPIEGKPDFGLQLHQLTALLNSQGLKAEMRVVDDKLSLETMRKELAANINNPKDFALVNFQRKALSQPGGGHISPVAAYDPGTDSFLILDVNPNTGPWFWVSAEALHRAMNTLDTVQNRGYVLIQEEL